MQNKLKRPWVYITWYVIFKMSMSFKVILLCYTIDSFRISVANSNKLMILISEKSTKNQEEQKFTREITWWCGYIEGQ